MKKFLSVAIVVTTLFISSVRAQQNVQFTQYMYNTLAVNPAYAGSREVLNASVLGRFQWVGFDGAPRTQTFYVHSPLPKESMGLGLNVTNDKIGPSNNTYINASYSYTIKLNENGAKLSFGASAGGNALNLKTQSLTTTANDHSDNLLNTNISSFKPNFGFGTYYHTNKFYLGVSTPKILQNKIMNSTLTGSKEMRHYYFIGGGIITLAENWKLKPTTMVKVTKDAPISIDLTLSLLFAERLWLGASQRIGDSFSFLFGYKISDQLQVGYAFDQTTTKLAKYNSGSHEVFLSYDFVFNQAKLKSPRYF